MTASFAYSDQQNAPFPEHCRQATLVWGDIAKTFLSSEIGQGVTNDDGSVKITYTFFEVTLQPDGTFSGKRIIGSDAQKAD